MTQPKPLRTTDTMKHPVTSFDDDPQPVYIDLDASVPAVTDGSQSEIKVKPVPRPRSKLQPQAQCNSNTVDTVETTSNAANAASSKVNDYPADYKRPHPVRPPPRPPQMSKCVTSSKPTAAVDGGNHYISSNTEPTVKPPTVSTERIQSPPPLPPERPPLPAICDDRPPSSKSETRPPPPPFNPPPLPSRVRPETESVYSEIDYHPYLEVLPQDDRMTRGQSTVPSEQHHQDGGYASHERTTEDAEDIDGLLKWLKRVSKSDCMTPSVYGLSIDEEIRSFSQRAMNVRKALCLYNLLMMKRNGSLQDLITEIRSISDNLDKMLKKTKSMGIAGGTTGAVGGVTAVLGIALAPMTMGASLIATAVGAGMVASAGGMGAHTAKANKKIVDKMTVEKLVHEYTANVVDLERCLDFILSGMNELRRHDIARLQRAGAWPDAVKMAHLSHSVFSSNMNKEGRASVARAGGMASEKLLQAFAKEMDQYFKENNSQKLKKSNKSRFSGRVRLLADNLQDELDQLNRMWEMLS